MKKISAVMFAVAIIFASCSKEAKLNKRLDGEWNVTTINGVALPSGVTSSYKFTKDKKGKGTYSYNWSDGTDTDTETGTYDLVKDDKITMTADGGTDVMTVEEYSKTKLKIKDIAGEITEMAKK